MADLLAVLTWLCIALVVYVYVGYPALLWLLARVARNPVQKDLTYEPVVTLIVAAYNEQDYIAEKVRNSFELDYPADKLQIIIVTDGSSDQTPDVAREAGGDRVTVMHTPERNGKTAAMNRAVPAAVGEILVFSDANAYYYPDAIRHVVANFADPQVGCVSGKKTTISGKSSIGESEGAYWKYESFMKKQETLLHSSAGVVGEMNAIRRADYHPIEKGIINDDAYMAMRVMRENKRVIYEPLAVSWETSALSVKDEVIRRRRINSGRWQLFFRFDLWPFNNPLVLFTFVSHKFLRLLLPFFMIGAVLFNVLAVLAEPQPILIATLIAQFIAYDLALVGYLGERYGFKFKPASIIYYIVSSNGASLEGFMTFLRGKQTVNWEKARRG